MTQTKKGFGLFFFPNLLVNNNLFSFHLVGRAAAHSVIGNSTLILLAEISTCHDSSHNQILVHRKGKGKQFKRS